MNKSSAALFISFASVALLGIIDFTTGWQLGFFVFYFLPVAAVAWYCRRWQAISISLFAALVWFLADYLLQDLHTTAFYALWNATIRLLSFLIISLSVLRIRELLGKERKISTDLREALSQVKTLKGLLPICASCHRIRNDNGYWQRIEGYIQEHSDAAFSHALCEECARKLYPEMYQKQEHGPTGVPQP